MLRAISFHRRSCETLTALDVAANTLHKVRLRDAINHTGDRWRARFPTHPILCTDRAVRAVENSCGRLYHPLVMWVKLVVVFGLVDSLDPRAALDIAGRRAIPNLHPLDLDSANPPSGASALGRGR